MNQMSFEQLDQVRQDTNTLVPGYFINELNPKSSLENGIGNCFSKAMIAAGIIVVKHGIEPSTFYSHRIHGSERPNTQKPIDRITKKNMAHISLLVPSLGAGGRKNVLGVSFGMNVVTEDYRQIDEGQITTYDDYAMVDYDAEIGVDSISPKKEAAEHEMSVLNWREGSDRYLDELDRERIDLDNLVSLVEDRLKLIQSI